MMLRELEHLPGTISIISKARLNVRYWHKADLLTHLFDVRFWG